MHDGLRVGGQQDVPHFLDPWVLNEPLLHLATMAEHTLGSLTEHDVQRILFGDRLLLGPGWLFLLLLHLLLFEVVKRGEGRLLGELARFFIIVPLLNPRLRTFVYHVFERCHLLRKFFLRFQCFQFSFAFNLLSVVDLVSFTF